MAQHITPAESFGARVQPGQTVAACIEMVALSSVAARHRVPRESIDRVAAKAQVSMATAFRKVFEDVERDLNEELPEWCPGDRRALASALVARWLERRVED